jgi:hypothetical protein
MKGVGARKLGLWRHDALALARGAGLLIARASRRLYLFLNVRL